MAECNHNFRELFYYYDNENNNKGSNVWDRKSGELLKLHYCTSCGIVKALSIREANKYL